MHYTISAIGPANERCESRACCPRPISQPYPTHPAIYHKRWHAIRSSNPGVRFSNDKTLSIMPYLILALFQISHDLYENKGKLYKRGMMVSPLVSSAKYRPSMRLSIFKNISRKRDSPIGLYLRLNLSNRWNESWWACMSRVSIERSYALSLSDWKTCSSVRSAPSRNITTSYKLTKSGYILRRVYVHYVGISLYL